LKDQLGKLAYPLTALQQLGNPPVTRYHITIDGREIEAEGVQCTIANSAQMGLAGLALAQKVEVSDGALDVIVLKDADLIALAEIATSNLVREDVDLETQLRRLVVPILAPAGDQPVTEIHPHGVVGPVTLPRFVLCILPAIFNRRAVLAEDHPVEGDFHVVVAARKAGHGRAQRLAAFDELAGHHDFAVKGVAVG
jgi:hypothetical protein